MNRKLLSATIALFAMYFPVAFYLKATPAPSPDTPKIFWLPYPPFPRLGLAEKGNAYVSWLPPDYDELADDDENPDRSPLLLFEDGKQVGSAHSSVADIMELGAGRYVHLKGQLVFSPSDNGDPNGPWRKYHVQPGLKSK
jgi:hypothetical protein